MSDSPPPGDFPSQFDSPEYSEQNQDKNFFNRHLVLLVVTIITALFAGAVQAYSFMNLKLYGIGSGSEVLPWKEAMLTVKFYLLSFSYAFSVLLILGTHEMGHYLTCRKYDVNATFPYFIPGIPPLGTFGAFIKIKSPLPTRKVVFDIGIAGPLAGFILAVPITLVGMIHSPVLTTLPEGEATISYGEPLLMKLFEMILYPDMGTQADIFLHPMAFAGWVGLFATGLNLLPVGQLDGGHIIYAVFGEKSTLIGKAVFFILISLIFFTPAVIVWGAFLLMMGFRHPPPLYEDKIGLKRIKLGMVALIVFILSFVPIPVHSPGWSEKVMSFLREIKGVVL